MEWPHISILYNSNLKYTSNALDQSFKYGQVENVFITWYQILNADQCRDVQLNNAKAENIAEF